MTGVLRISVGGTVKAVPTLKIKQIPEWTRLLDAYTPSRSDLPPEQGFTIASTTETAPLLDLIVAYDLTGSLGDRGWLESNADPAELREAVQAILANIYPKGLAVMAWLTLSQKVSEAVGLSVRPNSTNGASTPGTKTRMKSARRSTRSS